MQKKAIDRQSLIFFTALAVVTAIRLLISQGLWIHFAPDSTYDDLLQITKAFSITNGQWLGEYNSMTLVKGVGYPLLTALFHAVGLPYLLGWNLLYVLACAAFLWAVWPLIGQKRYVVPFLVYCLVLFNPIAFDSNINRYYRDIGYYSLAFLTVSLFLGSLIRRGKWQMTLLCGAALALAVLMREDCQWLYIYAAACLGAGIVLSAGGTTGWLALLRRTAAAALAAVLGFAAVAGPVAGMNYRHYGTFALDEYNSGSYARAYGALSRLDGGLQDPHIVIPYEQRMALYQHSPAFAQLYEQLDAPDALFAGWKEMQGEYRAGYFSFVLRSAAEKEGLFCDAATANAYFEQLAKEVNAYADTVPGAGAKRSGITARFYPKDLPAILLAWGQGVKSAVCYAGVSAIPVQCDADDTYLKTFEEYTGSECAANRYCEDGTITENYHPAGLRLWLQRAARVLTMLYQWVTPILMAAAVLVWLWNGFYAVRMWRDSAAWMKWVAQSSLLCAFLLRVAMLAFVHATTFPAVDNPAYQAASYPIMLGFIAVTLAPAVQQLFARLQKKKS